MKPVMDDERHKRDFEEVRENCPWRDNTECTANLAMYQSTSLRYSGLSVEVVPCLQNNCALYHFKKFFEGRK